MLSRKCVKVQINTMTSNWSFSNLWNRAIETREPRENKKRDYLWASELGGSMADLYLKLNGTPPTNPPNARSIRKFAAGDYWEAIVKNILLQAGIMQDYQKKLSHQYDGLMRVSGKLDFMAGGKLDYDKAMNYYEKDTLWMPESMRRGVYSIITGLHEKYGDLELSESIIEVKSCSTFMMNAYEALGTGSLHHKLQTYHYKKTTGKEGRIVYICRDDCRMLEIPVQDMEQEYKEFIEKATEMMKSNKMPEKEKEILFSEETGKFSSNYKIEYSNYLTLLYGYQTPREYSDKAKSRTATYNRVIGRIAKKDNLTDKNKEVIDDITKTFGGKTLDRAVELRIKLIAYNLEEDESA